MTILGDRRSRARFDVVGALWGSLETTEPARVKNVSRTGALIDAPMPAALDSTQTIQVIVEGEPVSVGARVRHVTRVDDAEHGAHYLIGLEFIAPPESITHAIEALSR